MYMKHSNILSLTSNVEKVSLPQLQINIKNAHETDKSFTRNFGITRKISLLKNSYLLLRIVRSRNRI